MSSSLIQLSPQDPWPELQADTVVVPIPDDDRQRQAPDVTLVLHERGRLLGRCSCWWQGTARHEGMATGVIGHYAAADAGAGRALLQRACERIAAAGGSVAIGPMDGNTWRRYRFVVERGDEPVFLLEPDNPDEWPAHWTSAGFATLATYTSAINDDLAVEDPRTDDRLAQLEREGVRLRTIDVAHIDVELPRIHALSLRAFAKNFLYTPLGAREFAAQYHAVLPLVRPELVRLAERGDDLIGFMFAIPDALQARRGQPVDTVILKTIAVDPSATGSGLGSAMLDLAQRAARELGFKRAIHALIHESNTSKRISDRYARTIRRYALFARVLTP